MKSHAISYFPNVIIPVWLQSLLFCILWCQNLFFTESLFQISVGCLAQQWPQTSGWSFVPFMGLHISPHYKDLGYPLFNRPDSVSSHLLVLMTRQVWSGTHPKYIRCGFKNVCPESFSTRTTFTGGGEIRTEGTAGCLIRMQPWETWNARAGINLGGNSNNFVYHSSLASMFLCIPNSCLCGC